jgi:hypothetical protein
MNTAATRRYLETRLHWGCKTSARGVYLWRLLGVRDQAAGHRNALQFHSFLQATRRADAETQTGETSLTMEVLYQLS